MSAHGEQAALSRYVPYVLLPALLACSDSAERDLAARARSAVLDIVHEPISARFDDSNLVALDREGLVCGGRVDSETDAGDYAGFQPYYYHRHRGAALPTHETELYTALMRECGRALK